MSRSQVKQQNEFNYIGLKDNERETRKTSEMNSNHEDMGTSSLIL